MERAFRFRSILNEFVAEYQRLPPAEEVEESERLKTLVHREREREREREKRETRERSKREGEGRGKEKGKQRGRVREGWTQIYPMVAQ